MKNFVIVIIVLLALSIITLVSIACRDISAPDISDLVPERIEVLVENNAYTYFNDAVSSIYKPTNPSLVLDYLKGKPVDDSIVQEVITKNTETFSLIVQGLSCGICQVPEITSFDSDLHYLSVWLSIGRTMALKSMHERQAGDYEQATDTNVYLLRFGYMVQKNAGHLINYLVGIGILNIGLEQARHLARDKEVSQQELSKLSRVLAKMKSCDQGLIRAFKVEHKVYLNTINNFRLDGLASTSSKYSTLIPRSKLVLNYFFQPNRTKQSFANFYRDMIQNAQHYYIDMDMYDIDEKLGTGGSKAKLYIRPNAVGRTLCSVLIPPIYRVFETKCRAECTVSATRLIVECNAYKKSNEVLPGSLESLIPIYLNTVPLDAYDGKPFRYSRSKGIVYSIGKDLKDSGGSTIPLSSEKRPWRGNTEDEVFEINIKTELENPPGKE